MVKTAVGKRLSATMLTPIRPEEESTVRKSKLETRGVTLEAIQSFVTINMTSL